MKNFILSFVPIALVACVLVACQGSTPPAPLLSPLPVLPASSQGASSSSQGVASQGVSSQAVETWACTFQVSTSKPNIVTARGTCGTGSPPPGADPCQLSGPQGPVAGWCLPASASSPSSTSPAVSSPAQVTIPPPPPSPPAVVQSSSSAGCTTDANPDDPPYVPGWDGDADDACLQGQTGSSAASAASSPPVAGGGPSVSRTSITLTAGKSQELDLSETGPAATSGYTASSDNAGIASVSPKTGASKFTITGVAPGTATVAIVDSNGNQILVSVTVTKP